MLTETRPIIDDGKADSIPPSWIFHDADGTMEDSSISSSRSRPARVLQNAQETKLQEEELQNQSVPGVTPAKILKRDAAIISKF